MASRVLSVVITGNAASAKAALKELGLAGAGAETKLGKVATKIGNVGTVVTSAGRTLTRGSRSPSSPWAPSR